MTSRDLIEEMNAYYAHRAPWHDEYLSYVDDRQMEELLGPLIKRVEPMVRRRSVLEIACGTGNWTQVLSKRADSVLGVDVNESMLEIARTKTYGPGPVQFDTADAYNLNTIDRTFTAAFASDWWSHVPRPMLPRFLESLHGRLEPGAVVIFIDMLPQDDLGQIDTRFDDEGNRIDRRRLPDGQEYWVVKNFPTEIEIRTVLSNRAANIEYYEDDPLKRWLVTYEVV